MPLAWKDQAVFSGILITACILIGRFSDSRLVTSTLSIASLFCTFRYIIWRWSSSLTYLNNSGWNVDVIGMAFALLLLCAETYAVVVLLLGYFQSARPLQRKPVPMPSDISLWPFVDVFIPTYNEPLDVVRPTVLAALGIDWPSDRMNVYILDDGRRPEFKRFAEECGAGYLVRSDNKHAKAGNINAALKKTSAEYIAIFDCDHIATRSFLQLTMGWFAKDKKLAMVQTPHHFYSPDPFERNLNVFRTIPNEGALFYGVVQDGNDLWNATFFCGSCAVIKREALEQIGGIAVETVTEDAHTALRLQRLGWNTAYIGIPQAAGLATGSLAAHVGQRIRWARGMVQILRTEFPLFASGLKLPQRLCYLNCALHYLYAIPRLTFVSAPLVYLLLGKSNVYGFMWEILAYAAPHLILSNMVNSRTQGDHRHSFWNEVYEMVLAPYILLPTTFALINPKWGKFNVTAKSSVVEDTYFDWKIARPYLALITLNVIAIIVSVPRYFMESDPSGVLLINIVWAMLNTVMLGACVAVSYEQKQRRATARIEAALSATFASGANEPRHCTVIDLSEGGVALRSEYPFISEPSERGEVIIRGGSEEHRFAVESVRTSENRIHLRFLENDLKHQRAVTKLIYARADSWLDWTKDQRQDRIINSLVQVFGIGARGIWMLPSMMIKREKKGKASSGRAVAKTGLQIFLACLLLAPLSKSHAAESHADRTQRFQERQTFFDLGRKAALVLHGDTVRAAFSFAIPTAKIVDSAELAIRYQTIDAPSDGDLRLAISLNDVEVTVISVKTSPAESDPVRVSLPADLLVHDNTLSFQLRRDCPAPCKPLDDSVSVRIEPATELLTLGLVLRLPDRLAMLPAPFFDPSIHRSTDVPFVFDLQPDLPSLRAAGVLASWYGALAGYRGTHFTTTIEHFPRGNVILLAHSGGTVAESLGLHAPGAQVAICDNPADPYGKVLAVVASSSEDLVRLAQFVTRTRFTQESSSVEVPAEYLATVPTVNATPVWSDASHPIHITANLNESLLHARIGAPTRLYFRIAPDLDYGTHITVPLHLSYRLAGLGSDDHVWIGIRLNDTFVTRRRLSVKDCGEAKTQSFAIPVSLLYSSNTLNLELSTNRSDANDSDPAAVVLQVLPASTLDLGNPTHFVRMPRLDLFAAAGYPFTSKADGSQTLIVVPDFPSAAQVTLYLDAMGFLGAQSGVPAVNFQLSNAKNVSAFRDRNFLVIASSNDEGPVRPFEPSMFVIPANGTFEFGNTQLPWAEWLSRAWLGRREATQKLQAVMEGENSPKFLIEQCRSPYRSDRSVVLLATRSETDDQPYFDRLSESSREGLIKGGIAVASDGRFQSFNLNSRSYTLGAKVSLAAVYAWLRFHLWVLPLILIGVFMLLAFWWEQVVSRQAERRLRLPA